MSEFTKQYWALRKGVAWIDRSSRAKVEMTGQDRVRFLNGMITNDVGALRPGKSLYGAMLTTQGRIAFDLYVHEFGDRFLLESGADLRTKLLDGLSKYIIMDEVELKDVTDQIAILSLAGPLVWELLELAKGSPLVPLNQFEHTQVQIQDRVVRLVRNDYTGSPGLDVWISSGDHESTKKWLIGLGEQLGMRPIESEVWNVARVEAGRPLYGVDMDDTNLPLESGLQDYISTTKGCYLGQEVVTRVLHMGHVNRRLVGLRLSEALDASGRPRLFSQDKEVGFVTSAVESPIVGAPIALGYARREVADTGTLLWLDLDGRRVDATVTPLPFFGAVSA